MTLASPHHRSTDRHIPHSSLRLTPISRSSPPYATATLSPSEKKILRRKRYTLAATLRDTPCLTDRATRTCSTDTTL
eukprot:scaffold41415_cov264-Isochrysis_galbana.AAC.1